MEVMEQLKNRPGNFSFMDNNFNYFKDISWSDQLAMDYRTIDKFGPKAWEFLKTCEDFFGEYINRPYMYYKIYSSIYHHHIDAMTFRASISHMQMLSRMGWEKYKLIYTIAHN